MPFVLVLPLIVIGIVIAASKKAAEQNKRAAAARRNLEQAERNNIPTEGQANYTPVRPSVQVPPVRKAPTAPRPAQTAGKAYQSPFAQQKTQVHPKHEDCSLRPDSTVKPAPPYQHPKHEDCSLDEQTASKPEIYTAKKGVPMQSEGTKLDFTPDKILNGVLYSEIFGKPKALR